MQPQRTQSQGHFGVVFSITTFTVTPTDRPHLREFFLCELGAGCRQANDLIVELYDRMQAGARNCEMRVHVSKPLLREHADALNEQRTTISWLVATAAAGPFKPLGKVASLGAGGGAKLLAQSKLRTYHAGDVIFSVQASVQGGLGPQRSVKSILIKARSGA